MTDRPEEAYARPASAAPDLSQTTRDSTSGAHTFGSDVTIGGAAGLHPGSLDAKFECGANECVVEAAQRRGIGVSSIAAHALAPIPVQGLMLGYGLVDVDLIDEGTRVLADAYREVSVAPSHSSRKRENSRAER